MNDLALRIVFASAISLIATPCTSLILQLGHESIVQSEGSDLQVDAYSVPCLFDWNDDDLPDLLIGEGGVIYQGTVHLFLNQGEIGQPDFVDAGHLMAGGSDLQVPGSGCLGAFPRVVFWNEDDLPDLIVGDAYGQVSLFLNEGEPGTPDLAAGVLLEVGPPEGKSVLSVGGIATPIFLDWDEDGRRDLLVGAYDGRVHVFLNEGSDTAPDFHSVSYVQGAGGDLMVLEGRASPVVMDLNGDGRKDLLSGNKTGEILIYLNEGTNAAPLFSVCDSLEASGLPIDYPDNQRSRPFICDWAQDGYLDLLVGLGDGCLHLFQNNVTSVAEEFPHARLLAPWPNPANPRVHLGVNLGSDGQVQLAIYDVSGRRLAVLADLMKSAGTHEFVWDGRADSGEELPSGVYLARLKSAGRIQSQPVVLLR